MLATLLLTVLRVRMKTAKEQLLEMFIIEVVILSLVFLAAGIYSCSVSFEAENGRGDGKYMYRDHASGGISVLLLKDEQLGSDWFFHSTTDNSCTLSSLTLWYGNDGFGDRLQFFLNNTFLGGVTTISQSNGGDNWNVIKTAKLPLSNIKLSNGHYIITVIVADADPNGVELDRLSLELDCSRPIITDGKECLLGTNSSAEDSTGYVDIEATTPPSTSSDNPSDDNSRDGGSDEDVGAKGTDMPTKEKVGIACGVISAAVATFAFIFTVVSCYMKKKCGKKGGYNNIKNSYCQNNCCVCFNILFKS